MLLFSVIIPTFNRAELLGSALESVFAQRGTEFEIIVVDDGSADRTIDYLHSLGNRVSVLRQSNRGPGSARNLGARHAQGKYLAFLDSDDLWFPWTLEVYQAAIRKHCDPSFIVGKPYAFSDEHELDRVIPAAAQTEQFADYLASGDEWRWWGVSSFVIRHDAFTAAGGFTNEWVNGEDADLALRLGVAAGFVQITAPVTFAYREHAASAMKDAKRTLAGAWSKVYAEQLGRYPGGSVRARERRRILTRHTRPVTLSCLQQGLRREAWKLYGATFAWNAALGRVKYLTVFPLLAAMSHSRATESAGTKLGANSEK
jgi:GT2 family glycosyltransferase